MIPPPPSPSLFRTPVYNSSVFDRRTMGKLKKLNVFGCDVLSSEPLELNEAFRIGLGAMYGPLIVHMPPATVNHTF